MKKNCKKKTRILEQFKVWDIPRTTEGFMKVVTKKIIKKYPNKPVWIIVWEYCNEC